MQVKAVLFDIDGTLVDSNDFHVAAWKQAFREAGHTIDADAIKGQIGKGADMLVPALIPEADEAAQDRLGKAHGSIFKARYLESVVLFPQAHELLRHTSDRGQKVILASSASKEELDHYINLLNASDLVDAGTSSDDVENTKPAPDIFSTALKKVGGIEPEEAIVVGDTPYDVEAAAKCGVAAVGLLSGGFPEEALRSAGAVAIYADVAALLAGYDQSPLAASSPLP